MTQDASAQHWRAYMVSLELPDYQEVLYEISHVTV